MSPIPPNPSDTMRRWGGTAPLVVCYNFLFRP